MWVISKEFDFCYGHRVWSQVLDSTLSLDSKLCCRHIHGHQGKIIIGLSSTELIDGMCTDFKHLNWFKKFLDDTLDHKFIIDRHDPAFHTIIPSTESPIVWYKHPYGHSIVDPGYFKMLDNEVLIELLEGFVVVEFVPTSENLSKWLFEIVKNKMSKLSNVTVDYLHFYETPKSSSKYIA